MTAPTDALPEWQPETIPEEQSEETSTALALVPEEEQEFDVVAAVEELLAPGAYTQTQQLHRAELLAAFCRKFNIQQRRIDLLIGKIAVAVEAQEIWRYVPGCDSAKDFWAAAGWHSYDHIARLMELQRVVIPLFEEAGMDPGLLEEMTPAKLRTLVSFGHKIRAQRGKRGASEQPEAFRSRVQGFLNQAVTLSDGDLRTQLDAQAGKPERIPILLPLERIVTGQGPKYRIQGSPTLSATQFRALADHRGYFKFFVHGEEREPAQLAHDLDPLLPTANRALPLDDIEIDVSDVRGPQPSLSDDDLFDEDDDIPVEF